MKNSDKMLKDIGIIHLCLLIVNAPIFRYLTLRLFLKLNMSQKYTLYCHIGDYNVNT